MELGPRGLALLKSREELRLAAYDDKTGKTVPKGGTAKGTLSIGFGHTGADVVPGLVITEEQAEMLLRNDVATAVAAVNRGVVVPINQANFDALCALVYNIGRSAFVASTVRRLLNSGDPLAACAAFMMWRKVETINSLGLARRRVAEMQLFLSDGLETDNGKGD